MAFTALVVATAVATGYLRGGRLRRIAASRINASWLLFVGLSIQLAAGAAAARSLVAAPVSTALLVTSQLLVAGWVVKNRYRPGLPLIFAGLALNTAVIAANGSMPVDPKAIEAIGLAGVEPAGRHELLTATTRLAWLADRLPLPPLRTVVSVGDAVLAAGLLPLVSHLMTYRPAVERRGGQRGEDAAAAPRPLRSSRSVRDLRPVASTPLPSSPYPDATPPRRRVRTRRGQDA